MKKIYLVLPLVLLLLGSAPADKLPVDDVGPFLITTECTISDHDADSYWIIIPRLAAPYLYLVDQDELWLRSQGKPALAYPEIGSTWGCLVEGVAYWDYGDWNDLPIGIIYVVDRVILHKEITP